MTNIYEVVAAYYQLNPDAEAYAQQREVERYFRRRAWKGADEMDMVGDWAVLALAFRIAAEQGIFSLDSFQPEDFVDFIRQYFVLQEIEQPKEAEVQQVFARLRRFLLFLFPHSTDSLKARLDEAQQSFYGGPGGAFQMPASYAAENPFGWNDDDELSDEAMEKLDGYINELLNAFQEFYRAPKYRTDIQRALYLYFGPVRMKQGVSDDEEAVQQEFRAFWDFFMFDYHLMGNDETPIAAFAAAKSDSFSNEVQFVLRDLQKSRFTVFCIEAIEEDAIVCRNLFSDDLMELPRPEELPPDARKLLFYGHMHEEGVMLLNGIVSVPATAALRRRIVQEIERMFALYRIQAPDATVLDFFARHAAAVRHIIDQMTSYAKLRAFPEVALPEPLKAAERTAKLSQNLQKRLKNAEKRLDVMLEKLDFSSFECGLVYRMLCDFCEESPEAFSPAHENTVLATATLLFAIQNLKDVGEVEDFLGQFHTTSDEVTDCMTEYYFAIDNWHPDPRYLSEAGFVNLMFDWSEAAAEGQS